MGSEKICAHFSKTKCSDCINFYTSKMDKNAREKCVWAPTKKLCRSQIVAEKCLPKENFIASCSGNLLKR